MQRKSLKSKAVWLRLLPLLLVLGACATGTIREKILTLPVIEGATYVSQDTCAGCHDDKAEAYQGNVHGRLADFELMGAQGGCEACHGPGSLHVAGGGDPDRIFHPGKLAADQTAALCAKCHTDGHLMDWTHGEHALADVGCTDCHTMHGEDAVAGYLKKADPDLCFDCHQEQMAQTSFPSHHPIKEGKMVCSDCHNPHGELRTAEQSQDLCLGCHARYQGPFVYEHVPVQEDCSICHDPHGSVANNMLKQNEPFLCLQCHESHFHATRVGSTVSAANVAFSATNPDGSVAGTPVAGTGSPPTGGDTTGAVAGGTYVNPGDPPATVQITNTLGPNSWQMAFGTRCTVCHSVVHGSDLPSQSAPAVTFPATDPGNGAGQGWPSGGAGLTR